MYSCKWFSACHASGIGSREMADEGTSKTTAGIKVKKGKKKKVFV
jgi:hypothetical protein